MPLGCRPLASQSSCYSSSKASSSTIICSAASPSPHHIFNARRTLASRTSGNKLVISKHLRTPGISRHPAVASGARGLSGPINSTKGFFNKTVNSRRAFGVSSQVSPPSGLSSDSRLSASTAIIGAATTMPSVLIDPCTAAACVAGALAIFAAFRLISFVFADSNISKRPPPAHAFSGKIVWLVGASQGLGETLAKYFVDKGARVILSSRSKDALERVAAACGGEAHAAVLPLDLKGGMDEFRAATSEAYAAFDGRPVDVLLHCVGKSQRAAAEETTHEVDEEMFALNALGPIRLTKAVLPRMLEAGSGHIAVISSMAGVLPSPGQATYAATKHALQGFFKTLATEVCDRGVNVSLVCPGPIISDPTRPARKVYGSTGLVDGTDSGSDSAKANKNKVSPARVAELVGTAIYHKCPEVWVAKHPVLGLAVVMRLFPWLAWLVLGKVGPKRTRALKEGRSGYDVSSMISSEAKKDS